GHQLNRLLAELGEPVATGIVLFINEHVDCAVLGEEPDRLAVANALLAAVAVLVAVLADLQVTRQIDDLPDHVDRLASDRLLACNRGSDGRRAPGLVSRTLFADFTFGLLVGSGRWFRPVGKKNSGALGSGSAEAGDDE